MVGLYTNFSSLPSTTKYHTSAAAGRQAFTSTPQTTVNGCDKTEEWQQTLGDSKQPSIMLTRLVKMEIS